MRTICWRLVPQLLPQPAKVDTLPFLLLHRAMISTIMSMTSISTDSIPRIIGPVLLEHLRPNPSIRTSAFRRSPVMMILIVTITSSTSMDSTPRHIGWLVVMQQRRKMRQWAGFRQQQLQLLWPESTHLISLRQRLLLRVELLLLSNSSNLPLVNPTTCSVSLELESS